MRKSNWHSLKTQQQTLLLRRPLPPKLPKLPLCKKKVHTAAIHETEQSHTEESQGESALVKSGQGVSQSQRPVSIQSIPLGHGQEGPERVISIFRHSHRARPIRWKIPHSATGSMFIPSCVSASTRVFKNQLGQIRKARKSRRDKIDGFFTDEPVSNSLILANQVSKPLPTSYSRFIISKFNKRSTESRRVLKTPDFGQELPVDKVLISPIPSTTSVVPEPQWAERPAHRPKAPVNKVVINVASLPEARSLPKPALPRKPPRQTAIALIRTARKIDPDAHVLQGEGFKTTAATRYETVMAMTTLAIINCQIYGRNALNLKGFFLQHCPDLTAVAVQLLYLNLSFNNLSQFPMEVLYLRNLQVLKLRNNPIREIPSEIQQLKYLRNFCISFNFITELSAGLFCLNYLEELDVSYNEISDIPNDIQKLRSLQKLNVDGNYLNSFPPGILKLNLSKLHFENTFTSSYFWLENSLNDAPRLTDICSLFIVKRNLHKVSDFIPEKVQKYLKSEFMCDWCHGPRFGEGFHIIRSCDIFGASHIPLMFRVCSPACYVEIRGSSFVLEGFPSRKIALNMDWVKESAISDMSFYL
ncbi:leucine-rich repeat-containing protein 63 [Acomys russatus]|uniref:leucine-rich repeat-containing protein 63 n=1 Tax=Acomys russatus TaxID=60746 RepID=UPI0021E21BF4|nr:leucine-rich repeat-containing protein 63 [Acomys russatus]